jgi:hypothetical protein
MEKHPPYDTATPNYMKWGDIVKMKCEVLGNFVRLTRNRPGKVLHSEIKKPDCAAAVWFQGKVLFCAIYSSRVSSDL